MGQLAPAPAYPIPAHRRRAPGPRYYTPFEFFVGARRDPVGFLYDAAREFGDVVRFQAWPLLGYLVVRPEHVRHVLQENNRNYRKGKLIAKAKVLIGEGLFTSEGDFWLRQRRLAQPAFHRERIEGFAAAITESTASMLEAWRTPARTGWPIDVLQEMSALTLRVVGRVLFSIDLAGEAAGVGRALLVALEHLNHLATRLCPLPPFVPTPRNVRFLMARRRLDRVVLGIIERRRRQETAVPDLLSMLLAARDADTGEGMSDRQLRDEVMTFVLAGHETTAVALAWVWYLLARHPEIEERLRAEVRDVLGDRQATVADLRALALTRRVVEETMRLYPPVPVIARQAIGPDEIDGYTVPAGSVVMMSPYVTHRDPRFWDEPDRFDPDRFAPHRSANRPRFAYLPFGGGPRICIGNELALMEAQLILATVLQRFRLQLVPGHLVEPELRVTLRPRRGVPMTVHSWP
jgi:cytochrome P450